MYIIYICMFVNMCVHYGSPIITPRDGSRRRISSVAGGDCYFLNWSKMRFCFIQVCSTKQGSLYRTALIWMLNNQPIRVIITVRFACR